MDNEPISVVADGGRNSQHEICLNMITLALKYQYFVRNEHGVALYNYHRTRECRISSASTTFNIQTKNDEQRINEGRHEESKSVKPLSFWPISRVWPSDP